MTIRQNGWTLGAFCLSYCRIVATHHTLEDRSVFPHLRAQDAALGEVLDRLEQEHEVIADLLERVDQAMVTLVADEPEGMAKVQEVVDRLTEELLAHLSYEEDKLVGPARPLRLLLSDGPTRARAAPARRGSPVPSSSNAS